MNDQNPLPAREQAQPHNTKKFGKKLIGDMWRVLVAERREKRLAAEDDCPGLSTARFRHVIQRPRRSLYDELIGLGMALRFNLALELLDKLGSDEAAEKWRKDKLKVPRQLHQLGTLAPSATTHFFEGAKAEYAIEELCHSLDERFESGYEWIGPNYTLTPKIFCTPFHGDDAVQDFIHLLTVGEKHRTAKAHLSLIEDRHRYVEPPVRKEFRLQLFERLGQKNGGRPIQCITALGAPTGLEALATHLAEILPSGLDPPIDRHGGRRARDIYLIPCGRWIRPPQSRGLEYLVHNVAALLTGQSAERRTPDMSEADLERGIGTIRAALAERPAILVFVGFEAVFGPLPNLQRAIVDAPLQELLSHLSRPLLGKPADPYDVCNFEWTYFLVLGLSQLDSLLEYQQQSLTLPALDNAELTAVLEETGYMCAEEIGNSLTMLDTYVSEAEIALFDQIRHIERARGLPAREPFEDIVRHGGLPTLTALFIELLDEPGHRLTQAMVLLTALSITGMRRITLLRCLLLWQKAFPDYRCDPTLENVPQKTEGWKQLFITWLPGFSSLLRAGPGQPWRELDPSEHPFESPDGVSFNLASESGGWWNESIEFIHSDIKHAIAEHLAAGKFASLAIGIHDILCQEALRQHTLVLRHTTPADLLTLRSYRRGLLALYHGLISLPPAFGDREGYRFPELTGLPAKSESAPAERFQFLYCGLFHRLFGDKSSDRTNCEWGADAIRLEIIMFAHDNFLDFLRTGNVRKEPWTPDLESLVTREMLDRHYDDMATACIRAGYNHRWSQVCKLLDEHVEGLGKGRPAFSSIPEQVKLHMEMITKGPRSPTSGGVCAGHLKKFGISENSFHNPHWSRESAGPTHLPSAVEFANQVETIVKQAASAPQEQLQNVVSLLFLFGIMNADVCESRIGTAEFPTARLLGYLLPMIAARRAWALSFHANSFEAAPYLMADGLRTLARLGLEILRRIQPKSQKPGQQANIPIGAEELLVYLTTEVRDCLDEFTRDYYFHEFERAQMLILESRFARTAYRSRAMREHVQLKSSIILDSAWALDSSGKLDIKRHEVALDFLYRADQCLLRIHPLHSVRLRLLSERSSALRGLAHLQAKVAAESSRAPAKARELKHIVARLAKLAELEVEQMASLRDEIAEKGITWTNAEGASKWDGIVAYHRRATAELLRQL